MSEPLTPDELLAQSDPAEMRAARYRRERDSLRIQNDKLLVELAENKKLLEFHDSILRANPEPPKWLTPGRVKGGNRATVVAMLSDMHLDEVVKPEEIGHLNAYNRQIAVMRMQRWAEGVIKLTRDYLSGVDYDGLVVMLAGDSFSGNLHDLAETNEDTPFGSLLFWLEILTAAFELLHSEFDKMHLAAVVGNHGRQTRKPRTKLRARDNADWLFAHMLARQFSGKGITWDIPDSTDAWIRCYDTMHLLSHGDQVQGGSGVGGVWPPIMRMSGRKAQRYAAEGKTFDVLCLGHWHQLIMAPEQGLIINGSTKGYDEYAAVSNFRPERAQQAMWLVTPEHGISMSAPVIVADRKAEGW